MFRLENWYFLFLIIPLIYFLFYYKKGNYLEYSSIKILKLKNSASFLKKYIAKILFFSSCIFFIIALARPQIVTQNGYKKGINIVFSLDVSKSMTSPDIYPDRITGAKNVISNFVKKRANDKLGLVVFAGTAYTKVPLTLDHDALLKILSSITVDDVKSPGTAIGMGLAVAVNRLKKVKDKTKVIILATDGNNNTGVITPDTAINIAKELNIKVYAIGIGSSANDNTPEGIDVNLLEKIANQTGGKFYKATDINKFNAIFNNINKLEKSKLKDKNLYNYNELFKIFVIIGLFLLFMFFLINEILYISVP